MEQVKKKMAALRKEADEAREDALIAQEKLKEKEEKIILVEIPKYIHFFVK